MDQYFALLKKRQDPNFRDAVEGDADIGQRHHVESPRNKMVEYLALEFFSRLLESFHDFKDYCAQNEHDDDCAILDNDKLLLSQAFLNK